MLRTFNAKDALMDGYNNKPVEKAFVKPLYYSFKTLDQKAIQDPNRNGQTDSTKDKKKPFVIIDQRGTPIIQLPSGKTQVSPRIQTYYKNIS